MNLKLIFLLIVLFCVQNVTVSAETYEVVSPDGKLKVKLHIDGATGYEVWCNDDNLLLPSSIALNLNDGTVIGAGTVKNVERKSIDEVIPVLIGKNKELNDIYNELIVHYNENYDLVFRVYNEGVAYRFETNLAGEIIIKNEDAIFNFAGDPSVYFPEIYSLDNWERPYVTYNSIADIGTDIFAITPVLFGYPESTYKVALLESNVFDYPGLYIQQNGRNSVKGMWAHYPETVENPDNIYDGHAPITRFDYIARTEGTRKFPWRVIVVSDDDLQLLNNELVYKLAEPQRLTDVSWIQPGKTSWEWWHKAMLTSNGKADPANGIPANGNDNLGFDLYKYYIDFASANKIQYLTLDAGWDEGYIYRLCRYAAAKNVKIILWTWAANAVNNKGWMAKMAAYGVAGLKIDFFNRNDQEAMNWPQSLAEEAADLKMVLLLHGCVVPTGLNRTYPNILNYEAVCGNESNFWNRHANPDYNLQMIFIRMLAGAIDYTPGSMRNKTKLQFYPVDLPNIVPSNAGTRSHELAMYIIYDQYLGYLCDAPTEYMKYPDILDFFSKVPTVWDKTVPLAAKVGEYAVVAKQSGDDWFVGGMNNWKGKTVSVDFSFLESGINYKATVYKDGVNANSYATRYICEELNITKESKLDMDMANGGGFVVMISPDNASGINDPEKKSADIFAYVNQGKQILNIKSEIPVQSVKIFDISGRLLFDKESENANYSENIDISGWMKGTYIVRVKTDVGTETLKVLI